MSGYSRNLFSTSGSSTNNQVNYFNGSGATGPKGDTGLQGLKGDTGDTGLQGPIGSQGPQGLKGATGPQGVTGHTGPIGVTGATGHTGPIGATGATGPQGVVGVAGTYYGDYIYWNPSANQTGNWVLGSESVYIGRYAGQGNSGTNNTFLGTNTSFNPTDANANNSTAIGVNSQINYSNQIMLGGLNPNSNSNFYPQVTIPGSLVYVPQTLQDTSGVASGQVSCTTTVTILEPTSNNVVFTFQSQTNNYPFLGQIKIITLKGTGTDAAVTDINIYYNGNTTKTQLDFAKVGNSVTLIYADDVNNIWNVLSSNNMSFN